MKMSLSLIINRQKYKLLQMSKICDDTIKAWIGMELTWDQPAYSKINNS